MDKPIYHPPKINPAQAYSFSPTRAGSTAPSLKLKLTFGYSFRYDLFHAEKNASLYLLIWIESRKVLPAIHSLLHAMLQNDQLITGRQRNRKYRCQVCS